MAFRNDAERPGLQNLTAYTSEGKNLRALRAYVPKRKECAAWLPTSEFDRAKVNLIRRLEAAVEQRSTQESHALVWRFFGTLMRGDVPMSPEQSLQLTTQLLEAVRLENINALVDDYITEDNLTIAYSSFDREGMKHPSESDLLGVYAEVQSSEIGAYEDTVVSEPLMKEIPSPGQITKRKLHKTSGIKEWTLSNGVKVYSKKTDFKADEVLF
jgi:zinc protease